MGEGLEARLKNNQYKSRAEREIAAFLDSCGIRYVYEQGVLVTDDNKPKIWYPDFYLPEFSVYIEYYGLVGDPDYDRGVERKTAVYSANGLEVIALYPVTLRVDWQTYIRDRLREILARRLRILEDKFASTARLTCTYITAPYEKGITWAEMGRDQGSDERGRKR
jgi:hypothetical protein